jgi:iron-sulfur cluster assembly protein
LLTLTDNATTAVKSIVARTASPMNAGLRISADQPGGDFTVAIAPEPHPGDSVVEADGARVFLGEIADPILADKVLDASVADDGAVRFQLDAQK